MTRIATTIALILFSGTATAAENWHKDAFFGLHYDLHPNAGDTELGREATHEHIRAMLDKVKPDFVQYDCKGHPGYTGYPSEVGSPSPGIVNDALKVWREVTRDMGVPLSIHYSGVWDSRAIELHPEWARINPHGSKDKNYTCRLSGYDRELMIPQLIKVVKEYDIDGMWIDGENWASRPCWCERCKDAFKAESGLEKAPKKADDEHWHAWLAFHRALFIEHVKAFVAAVHEVKPTCIVTSNWMYSVRQPEALEAPIDYLSGDFNPSFGAERACAEARFISARGKPWDLMAWGFLRVGNAPWTMKTVPHLCQEVSEVLAQGGSVFIYNTPHRSGRLTAWHQDILGRVADFCRKRKDYCFQSETLPQAAILHSESSYYRYNDPLFNFGEANWAMEGALHAMLENGYSTDILNEAMLLERMSAYPLIVVPEAAHVADTVKQALRAYVEGGGRLLLTGGFVAEQYGDLAGIKPREGVRQGGFLPADDGAVPIWGAFQGVDLAGATEIAALLNQQEPERNRTGLPAATRHAIGDGVVVAIPGPVFRSYHQSHYPRLRRFIGDTVLALDTPRIIKRLGPAWVEIAARQKEGRLLIQLVNRGNAGYTAPNRHMVEHVADSGPFSLRIPLDERPKRCYMAPDEVGVEWTWKAGTLTAHVAGLAIHNVLVIE